MSEKHLRLTHDEFLAINAQLTEAELRVYLYLRTLDPFGDRKLTIDTSVISEQLGLVRRTVQKCLKSLESKKLIDWEVVVSKISTRSANVGSPSESRIAKRTQDRLGESRIVSANVGSPQRTQDRQQPLEVNQSNDSTTPHPSSSFFILSQSDRSDEFFDFENANAENLEISEEEAIATLQANLDAEKCDLSPDQDGELINTPEEATNPINGDSSRHKLEDFILKSMNFAPRDRQAYFAKFTATDWERWETKFKPPVSPPVSQRDLVNEDPWCIENAIASMVKCKDFDAAKDRLSIVEKTNPILATQLREKYLCS